MADKKVTALTAATSVAAEDLFMVVDNPSGTPVSKRVTAQNLFGAVPSDLAIVAGKNLRPITQQQQLRLLLLVLFGLMQTTFMLR